MHPITYILDITQCSQEISWALCFLTLFIPGSVLTYFTCKFILCPCSKWYLRFLPQTHKSLENFWYYKLKINKHHIFLYTFFWHFWYFLLSSFVSSFEYRFQNNFYVDNLAFNFKLVWKATSFNSSKIMLLCIHIGAFCMFFVEPLLKE